MQFTAQTESEAGEGGTHITLIAVVGRLVLNSTLVTDLLPCSHQLLSQNLDVLDGLHQAVSEGHRGAERDRCEQIWTHTNRCAKRNNLLDHLVGILVTDLNGASHVPGNVDHGND